MDPILKPDDKNNREKDGSCWASLFAETVSDNYGYVNNIEECKRITEFFSEVTSSRYVVTKVNKDFGETDFRKKPHRLTWECQSSENYGMEIRFDGVPFMIVSKKVMSCQYGSDKCVAQKRRYREKMDSPGIKRKRRNVVFTKKRDCPAQIRFREVIKFPDYKIVTDSKYNRRVLSRKCHHDMKTGMDVRFERRIYVFLPSLDDHQFHPSHKKGIKMRAAVIEGPPNLPKLTVIKVFRPEPQKTEVLIKVAATSVSRQDIAKRYGKSGVSNILGTEAAGTIEKVGNVLQSPWKKGDRVMCLLSDGGNAEFVLALENHIMPIPDFMSFPAAAAIPEVWLTAYHLLHAVGNIKKGDDVLIHAGASGVGTAAIQLVVLAGAHPIVTASSWSKLELCKNIGAVAGFNYMEQDFAKQVLEFTKGVGVNIILDCVGRIHCAGNGQVIATDGTWVIYGLLSGSEISGDLLTTILKKRVNIKGASMQDMNNNYKAELIKGFKENILPHFKPGGEVSLSPIINKMYPLKCIAEAHKFVESNASIGKVILTLEDDLIKEEQTKQELFEVAKSFEALADRIVEIGPGDVMVTQEGEGGGSTVLTAEALEGLTQIIGLKQGSNAPRTETEESVQVLLADKMDVESTVHVTTECANDLLCLQSIQPKNTVIHPKNLQQFAQEQNGNTFIYTGTAHVNQSELINHVQSIEQPDNCNQSETVHFLNQEHIEGQPQLIGHVQEVETVETDHLYQDQQSSHQSIISNNTTGQQLDNHQSFISDNATGQSLNVQTQQESNFEDKGQIEPISDSQNGLNQGFAQQIVYANQSHHTGNNKQLIFVLEENVVDTT